MIWIPPFALEISVVCVGIFLLMMDCFSKTDKISLWLGGDRRLLAILCFHCDRPDAKEHHSARLLRGRPAGPLL